MQRTDKPELVKWLDHVEDEAAEEEKQGAGKAMIASLCGQDRRHIWALNASPPP